MSLLMSNGLLNLPTLQQRLDELVFDYIDTKPNWGKAYLSLDELLEQSTSFFVKYVEGKDGQLPKPSSYWILYMEVNAKLIYFTTLALKNYESKSSGVTNEMLAERFETATKCLTSLHTEENEEFIEEIKESFNLVSNGEPFTGANDRTVEDCINVFYEFSKQY